MKYFFLSLKKYKNFERTEKKDDAVITEIENLRDYYKREIKNFDYERNQMIVLTNYKRTYEKYNNILNRYNSKTMFNNMNTRQKHLYEAIADYSKKYYEEDYNGCETIIDWENATRDFVSEILKEEKKRMREDRKQQILEILTQKQAEQTTQTETTQEDTIQEAVVTETTQPEQAMQAVQDTTFYLRAMLQGIIENCCNDVTFIDINKEETKSSIEYFLSIDVMPNLWQLNQNYTPRFGILENIIDRMRKNIDKMLFLSILYKEFCEKSDLKALKQGFTEKEKQQFYTIFKTKNFRDYSINWHSLYNFVQEFFERFLQVYTPPKTAENEEKQSIANNATETATQATTEIDTIEMHEILEKKSIQEKIIDETPTLILEETNVFCEALQAEQAEPPLQEEQAVIEEKETYKEITDSKISLSMLKGIEIQINDIYSCFMKKLDTLRDLIEEAKGEHDIIITSYYIQVFKREIEELTNCYHCYG